MRQAGRFVLAASAAVLLHLAVLLAPQPFRARIIPSPPVPEVRLAARQIAAPSATTSPRVSPPAKAPVPDMPPAVLSTLHSAQVKVAPVDMLEQPEVTTKKVVSAPAMPTGQSQPSAQSPIITAPAPQASTSSISRAPICQREPKPQMPALSRNLGEEGMVQLRLAVDETGKLKSVQMIKGSGFSRLDSAAQTAARQWHCQPALKQGVPIAAELDDTVVFELD